MCKSFRSAETFAHRSADYIRSCVKAFSLSQKPSTHLRIGKIPSRKQAFRGNFANPRFVSRNSIPHNIKIMTEKKIEEINGIPYSFHISTEQNGQFITGYIQLENYHEKFREIENPSLTIKRIFYYHLFQ